MRIVGSFTAKDDDQNVYTIRIWQGDHDTGTMLPGPRRSPDALGELRTDGGWDVNYVSKGVYDIIRGTEMIRVTSDDQNAP